MSGTATRTILMLIGVALILAVVVLTPARPAAAQSPQHAIAKEVKLSAKVEGGQKLCSSIWPGHFRDTVPMPPGATASACQSWMKTTGGTTYQQGCMFSTGDVSMGPVGGGVPTPNCGW